MHSRCTVVGTPHLGKILKSSLCSVMRPMIDILWLKYHCVLVAQSCGTLCDPMDSSPSGSFVHGIFQAGILAWVAISFSRGSS